MSKITNDYIVTSTDYFNGALMFEQLIRAERARLKTVPRRDYHNGYLVWLVAQFRWYLDQAARLERQGS